MTGGNGQRGGVAAGHAETAAAAAGILRAGGNAFDAALGGFLAACVVEPVLASLGGGGFLTSRSATGEIETFDFFTQTPMRRPDAADVDFRPITADFGPAQQEFHIGLGAVATPGAVAGMFAVHQAHGRMPMAELAEPAIDLARRGITVNDFQAYILKVVGPIYVATASSIEQFCGSDTAPARLLKSGEIYRPAALGDFLEALVREGPRLFYEGAFADLLASMPGCTIGRDDLAAYEVIRRRPWTARLDGVDMFLNPPPAIGGVLIGLAVALIDAAVPGDDAFGSPSHMSVLADAMRRCSILRRESGIDHDPEAGALKLSEIAAYPPAYRGTTHISVADGDGNLAALTVSNGEGCGHLVPGTGVMLNNMLGEDDLNAAGFLAWPENVRLSSMMAPGLAVTPDGTWTALGSGGSNRIRSAMTQVLVNLARHGMSLNDAVEAPRLHLEGGKLSVEPGFDGHAIDAAAAACAADKIDVWPERNMFFGGAHAVMSRGGQLIGGAGDSRRDGVFVQG